MPLLLQSTQLSTRGAIPISALCMSLQGTAAVLYLKSGLSHFPWLVCSLTDPQPPPEHLLHTVLEVDHRPEETMLRLLNEDTVWQLVVSQCDACLHQGRKMTTCAAALITCIRVCLLMMRILNFISCREVRCWCTSTMCGHRRLPSRAILFT